MSENRTYAIKLTGISSLLHFLVDGLCASTLYQVFAVYAQSPHVTTDVSSLTPLTCFLTYNVLAFLTQPLTGMLADRLRHTHLLLIASVAMLAAAVLAAGLLAAITSLHASLVGVLVVAALLGMGNSLFHVWGGKLTATVTGNDIRALGIFVATGAMGLSVGFLFFSWPLLIAMLLAICLLTGLCLQRSDSQIYDSTQSHPEVESRDTRHLLPTLLVVCFIVLLMMAVMLRSFVGETFSAAITKSQAMVLAIAAVAMGGKMAGGFIARRTDIVRALVLMVLIVAVCLVFSKSTGTAIPLLGLFVVNCTMPVTLYLANLLLPGHEGLAFGLLAAALMPGYLMAML
ncbi:MAG: MFS transporter [Prevotella sp.]|nr:MFS transporter [Prevotella sp.]